MLLELEDTDIRAKITLIDKNRVRLTIDYPRETRYRDRVMAALADLLRSFQSSNETHEAGS